VSVLKHVCEEGGGKSPSFLITTKRVPGCLASYSLYFSPEDDRRFFGARSRYKRNAAIWFEESRDFRTLVIPICPEKPSRPKPLQDLGRASAASHNMKLRLEFRLAYHHVWLTVSNCCFVL